MENLQGICKDCGNGTPNNEINPAFVWVKVGLPDEEYEVPKCINCGSHHVDVVVL